jgi:putative FmdB family regulatory protein
VPRYDFECISCAQVQEMVFRMADKPDSVTCPLCGGVMHSQIARDVEVLVMDVSKPFVKDMFSLAPGWHKGHADPDRYERQMREVVQEDRNAAKAVDKQAIRNGWRKIATVPGGIQRMRMRQFGKRYWEEDTKKKLKQDGLLFKD